MVALNQNAVKSTFGTKVRSRSYAFYVFYDILGQRVNQAGTINRATTGSFFMIVPQFLFFVARWQRTWLYLAMSMLLFSFFFAACSDSNPGGNSNSGPTAPSSSPSTAQVELAQLHWCGKPIMLFRDDGALTGTGTSPSTPTSTATGTATPPVTGTPKTITDWTQVEPNLGFTVYLPATLPQHTCLVSALGTIHDPILGGSFTIGYLLPDHSSISLAEGPLRGQSTQFQCNVSTTATTSSGHTGAEIQTLSVSSTSTKPSASPTPTQNPDQICSGVMNTTNIIFSARGKTESLQSFFNMLQPHVNWIPAS